MSTSINLQLEFGKDLHNRPSQIPIEFEMHFQQIIGHYASELPNDISYLSKADLNALYSHYLDCLKRAISINGSTADNLLVEQLDTILVNATRFLKSANTIEEMQFFMIATLGKVCFLLLGDIPQNNLYKQGKKRLSNKDFELNQHRSICYTQTAQQKANVICDYVSKETTMNEPSNSDPIYEERRKFRNDTEFIEWFKNKHKELYLKLF